MVEALSCRSTVRIGTVIGLGLLAACSVAPEQPPDDSTASATTVTLSAQDRASIDATLAQAAENLGLVDPPATVLVRVVPTSEYGSTQVSCLHEKGFASASLTADGSGVMVELPGGDQLDAYNLASYTCMAMYPKDPAQDESRMTRDQKHVVYQYVTQTLVECLEGEGYTIRGIPSEETFLATWDTGVWNPYAQLAAVGTPDSVLRACPQDTPPELIWQE